MVKHLNEVEFKEVIKTGKVLVDCYAEWCGPCKMLGPIIEDLATEVSEYSFYKLNVDEVENIAREYMIMSIPTLLIFEDGKLKEKMIGFKSKEELLNILKN